jgi:hypothetical protein
MTPPQTAGLHESSGSRSSTRPASGDPTGPHPPPPDHVPLTAAAPDRAHQPHRRVDQHLAPNAPGRRPPGAHHRREHHAPPRGRGVEERLVDLRVSVAHRSTFSKSEARRADAPNLGPHQRASNLEPRASSLKAATVSRSLLLQGSRSHRSTTRSRSRSEPPGARRAGRHQLGGDGHGDLFRRLGADVQTDGSVDGRQSFGGHAVVQQRSERGADAAAAPTIPI